ERDSYMAEKILEAEGGTILAVVGAGHVEGIKERLEQDNRADIDQLESIESNISVLKIAKYAVPSVVILLFLYGVVVLGLGTAKEMFFQWFIFNASFAAVGALASLAHPFTVLVSFLAAPFTSINPALPAGMVASLTENKVRQPKVGDLEALGEIESYRELWRNQATRLLLIFFLVNLGSSIATFIGAGALANLAGLL
ncbi:MAG: TraB family protein, partial [Candidatus Nanohaloarchaeota archaeon QJJ-9]|nr:TraB family protein [Candidatus Nanohaloarchaeota archaeon QJJ-9]